MQHTLLHPQPRHDIHLFAVLQQFVEWVISISLVIAAFPLLKEVGIYLLMKLYEIFIQYQY